MSKLQTRLFGRLRRLGEYELLRKIGSGGMAEVWMGRRAALAGASKVVAIKLLARNVLDDPAYRQMFLEEARLSMLLTNSNVVQVFDVGEVGDECYMVMEWVDGLNLSELRRKMTHGSEQVSTVAAAHIVGEVLRALAYAHGLHHDGIKATIVHRDVSPQNVLVSVSGEVKLADFGVARLAHEETSGLHVKGKLRYMAPEQLRGRSREATVDLYAVGAILHELLSGQRFRTTRDQADLYSMVLAGEYSKLPGGLPKTLVELTEGLLEPDPSKRLASADEALELLHSWPGYRNSSIELARVVQKWSGVSGPRSGFLSSEMVAVANSAAQTTPAQTRPRAASDPAPAAEPAGSELETVVEPKDESEPEDDRVADTRTFVEADAETSATSLLPETEAELAAARQASRGENGNMMSMLLGIAATLAVAFGIFGIGFPLGWWGTKADAASGDGDKATVVANKADEKVETDEKVVEPPPPDLPTVKTPVVERVIDGTETGTVIDGTEETDGDGETRTVETTKSTKPPVVKPPVAKPPPKKVPVEVTFKLAGGVNFVYIRVDKGKELALEPRAKVTLKSGSHTVYTRPMKDPSWTKAGRISLEPGYAYDVTMWPGSLELAKH